MDSLEGEKTEQAARLDEVIPKLTRVTWSKELDTRVIRISLDISPEMICTGFRWGGDERMIREFSERVGLHVYRELKTANMVRFK